MYISIYIYIYIYMYVCMHACMHACMDGWMDVCVYVCMYVFMYFACFQQDYHYYGDGSIATRNMTSGLVIRNFRSYTVILGLINSSYCCYGFECQTFL